MKYNEAQFRLSLARAAYWTALVNSGGYKLRRTQKACGTNPDGTFQFRDCTDEELLSAAMATIKRHIEIAAEFSEHLPIGEPVQDETDE